MIIKREDYSSVSQKGEKRKIKESRLASCFFSIIRGKRSVYGDMNFNRASMMRTMIKKKKEEKHSKRIKKRQLATSERREDRVCSSHRCIRLRFQTVSYLQIYDSILY